MAPLWEGASQNHTIKWIWLIAMERFPADPFDSFYTEREFYLYIYVLFLDSAEGPPFTTKLDQLSGGVLGLMPSQRCIPCCRFDP